MLLPVDLDRETTVTKNVGTPRADPQHGAPGHPPAIASSASAHHVPKETGRKGERAPYPTTPRLRVWRTVSTPAIYTLLETLCDTCADCVVYSLGAAGVSFGLPVLLYVFTFACNDVSGCPAPSLLSPKTIDLTQLKREVGWPADGLAGLFSLEVTAWTLAYYLFNAILYRVLPATVAEGTELSGGGRLKYRLNSRAPRIPSLSRPAAPNATDRHRLQLHRLHPRHLSRRHNPAGRPLPRLDFPDRQLPPDPHCEHPHLVRPRHFCLCPVLRRQGRQQGPPRAGCRWTYGQPDVRLVHRA